MRYLDYFIKCIIRRIVRIIFKPKILITILFILLIVTLSLYSKTYAAENGLIDFYNGINNQLVNVLDNIDNTYSFYKYFNNPDYSYFVYYGNIDGTDMFSNNYNTSYLNVAFYPSTTNFIDIEASTTWAGFTCVRSYLRSVNKNITVFRFQNNTDYINQDIEYLYMPRELHNFRSPVIDEYLRNQKNVQQITSSITEGTDKINDTVTDTNNFVKDDNISDESMNIDTSNMNFEDEQGVDNFFSSILTLFHDTFLGINDNVEIIEFNIPYTQAKLSLSSDIVSSHIKGTILEVYINLWWYFIFGSYFIMFSFRIISWFTSGKLAEEGVYSLSDYLDFNNIIIKSSMM